MRRTSLATLLLVTACVAGSTTSTTSTIAVTTTAATPETTGGTAPPFVEVEVGIDQGGTHLVDGEGRALYLFTLDEGRTSSCDGECATAWPPYLGEPVAVGDVDLSLLGNAERGDGAIQVTYGDHPLYTYSGDTGPGDTNGHGFNDFWFLVGPDGEPLPG